MENRTFENKSEYIQDDGYRNQQFYSSLPNEK